MSSETSDQAFLVVPMPRSGQSGTTDILDQQTSPETKEQVIKLARNIMNEDGNGTQDNSSHGTDAGQESKTVKKLLQDPSSLYSLINWENPRLTFSSLATVVTLLLAARYFHIMQWILKALSLVLGVVSIVEFCSRSTTGKSITARVKPQQYYAIPEPTLNRAFSELREAAQFIVMQGQAIVFAEDPTKTFVAFIVAFISYWLIKIFSLWQLVVISVPIIYTMPLLLSSRSKNQIRHVTNSTANKVSNTASDVKDKAQHTDIQQTTNAAANKVSSTASDLQNGIQGQSLGDMTHNTANKISSTTSDMAGRAQDANLISRDTAKSVSNTASSLTDKSSTSSGLHDPVTHRNPYATHTYDSTSPPTGPGQSAASTGEALFGAAAQEEPRGMAY